jgi:hypothetical protein
MVYSFKKEVLKHQNLLLGQENVVLVELDYPRRAHKPEIKKQNEELQMVFEFKGFNHYIGKCYDQRG